MPKRPFSVIRHLLSSIWRPTSGIWYLVPGIRRLSRWRRMAYTSSVPVRP